MNYKIHRGFRNLSLVLAAIVAEIPSQSFPATHQSMLPAFKLLHTFAGGSADGAEPLSNLTLGSDGNLYGTTALGGASNPNCIWSGCGTIFKMTSRGTVTLLYAFTGGTDGFDPFSGVTEGNDGNFYGTTAYGGVSNNPNTSFGTAFKITPTGKFTVLHTFTGGPDGGGPRASLVQGRDGNFYGTTGAGGAFGYGTVFKLTPDGTETVLHSFNNDGIDGIYPSAALAIGRDGTLYGTTTDGGSGYPYGYGCGVVFKLTPAGDFTVLYSFTNYPDGCNPQASLVEGRDGNLYGTTVSGGAGVQGTVFKISTSGEETVVYSFLRGADGGGPQGGLVRGLNGSFYGVTGVGGAYDAGTIFEVAPDGRETVLYSFAAGADGGYPYGGLTWGRRGYLYGTTQEGGASNDGTVFKFAPWRAP
jgi:uncharacterized repeat protein (TIGR03803 family)